MGSLDTNALISLLLPDRPSEQVAVTKLLGHSKLDVADVVFVEIEFTLRKYYNYTRAQICANIRGLSGLENINCNRQLLGRALPLYETGPSMSFVDCCLVVYAELNAATPLYTFDKKLVNQSGGLAKLIAA